MWREAEWNRKGTDSVRLTGHCYLQERLEAFLKTLQNECALPLSHTLRYRLIVLPKSRIKIMQEICWLFFYSLAMLHPSSVSFSPLPKQESRILSKIGLRQPLPIKRNILATVDITDEGLRELICLYQKESENTDPHLKHLANLLSNHFPTFLEIMCYRDFQATQRIECKPSKTWRILTSKIRLWNDKCNLCKMRALINLRNKI